MSSLEYAPIRRITMSICEGRGGGGADSKDHDKSNDIADKPKKTEATTAPAMFKYMECLKNHAATIGGNARDGCGEFLAAGEEGTIEALKCCACNCHRNFHRKIHMQQQPQPTVAQPQPQLLVINNHHHRHLQLQQQQEEAGEHQVNKKRFRTKFTQEQKEKMLEFAEKSGWKIQKLGESEVKRFCQEIGVKRKVLKVWMHNNKYHNIPKKEGLGDGININATAIATASASDNN